MTLFMKQDFTPPILSKRWFAIKLRPNMLLYNRENIISILESGLMFREDSIEVEQEAPTPEAVWAAAGGGRGGLTRGERVLALTALSACILAFPPRSLQRSTAVQCAAYALVPVCIHMTHRRLCRGALSPLLNVMREYLALARRAAACLKEYKALHAHIGSMTSVIESMHMLLCRQQSEMSIVMSRASSAVLGNAPWLRSDVAWDAVPTDADCDNLMKIHHAFLVVQSTLLKHIAMAHYIPSPHARNIYKNHNERIYWIHSTLINHLNEQFTQNFESLERMYRLLKNSANKDDVTKKLGSAINDSWLYSEVHTGIAKSCLELKLAVSKSNGLDMFLDSCAMNKQDLDIDILNNDIEDLIDNITKCLTTVQNSQIRLKKIRNKFGVKDAKSIEAVNGEEDEETDDVIRIGDDNPEPKDEVFYFIRTEDDDEKQPVTSDVTTMPGRRERENTKVVLCELKRKLGKREDVMRERERQALAKTMPEFKNEVPEFPRQILLEEFVERKGFIKKIKVNNIYKDKLFRNYKIEHNKTKNKDYKLKHKTYIIQDEIGEFYEANANLNFKTHLLTITPLNKHIAITKWCKFSKIDSISDLSDLNDTESKSNEQNQIFKFNKNDLELTPSSSDNEFDYCQRNELLKDVRRNRVRNRMTIDKDTDDSLKPIEYSFGTGLAMASVLQVNSKVIPNMSREEVFIGDGEVSNDSGNDDDT